MTVNGDWWVERNWSSGIERDREKSPFTVNTTKEAVVSRRVYGRIQREGKI